MWHIISNFFFLKIMMVQLDSFQILFGFYPFSCHSGPGSASFNFQTCLKVSIYLYLFLNPCISATPATGWYTNDYYWHSDGTPVDPSLFEGGFPANGYTGQPQSALMIGSDYPAGQTKMELFIGHEVLSGDQPACVKGGGI